MSTTSQFSQSLTADEGEAGQPDDVAEARARIEETRTHLSDTVDAIKEKLSPAHLIEEAKEATLGKAQAAVSEAVEAVKDSASSVVDSAKDVYHHAADKATEIGHKVADKVTDTVTAIRGKGDGDVVKTPAYTYAADRGIGASIVDTIKINPLPAALVGFGLGWLLLSIQKQQRIGSLSGSQGYGGKPRDAYDAVGYVATTTGSNFGTSNGALQGIQDHANSAMHAVSDKAADIAGSVGKKASDLSDRASDWAGGVRDTASQWKDKAGDAVNNLGVQTKQQAGAANDSVDKFIHEQPLAAAGIALVIGATLAYVIPASQKENAILGPQRDRLLDQGKSAAKDVALKVQSVATTALSQAQDSLSQTVDQAKQQIQQTVQQTHDTVVSEAHNQGLVGSAA